MVAEGRVLSDRYRIERRLASGGMGTVYVATDLRLDREVALKLLRDTLSEDERFVERFRREARAAAALSHPNIAGVYDFGRDGDLRYIVMELAAGTDLAHRLRDEGPLSPERTIHIGVQIAAALGHAHSAGLVHRDVKPANVLVDAADHVKVTDFGIARATGDATLTATGTILGTATYLSPEQASGSPIDARSDVYSLGVVLFEMLAGRAPFEGDTPLSIAMRHMTEDVPDVSSLRDDIPPELNDTIRKATAKEPSQRFRDATEMAAALGGRAVEPLGVPSDATLELPDDEARLFPIPERYNVDRLGRIVLISFVALLIIAASLLVVRLLQSDPPEAAQGGGQATSGPTRASESASTTPTPTPSVATEGFQIPDMIYELSAKDAKKALEALGFHVETVKEPSDAEKDTILGSDPEQGSYVQEGDTITLYVSDGHGADDEEDDD